MPITTGHDTDGIITLTYAGTPSVAEVIGTLDGLAATLDLTTVPGVLVDRRAVVKPPTANDAYSLVSALASMGSRVRSPRWAIVVTTDAGAVMARLTKALLEQHMQTRVGVFHDIDAARQWVLAPDDKSLA